MRNIIKDVKGQMSKIIGISVGLLVAAILVPIGINEIMTAENIADWGVIGTVFTVLLPVLAVIAIALYFVPKIKG